MAKPSENDLRNILSKITKVAPEKIKLESKLRAELGIDSLSALELLVVLEEDYGLAVTQDAAHHFVSFGDLVNHVAAI